jgi:hypothetical protein
MNAFRQKTIRHTILAILEETEPQALPETTLQVEVDARVRPAAAQAEFDDSILFLQSHRFIKNLPDEMDEDLARWFITEAGKTLLGK